jgi:hypothetical protein
VWAAGLFTVAGIAFAKLTEDFVGRGGGMYALLVAGAAVALLALVAAAAPSAVALLRGRDAAAWRYVAVPVVGLTAWYGLLPVARRLAGGSSVHSAPTTAAFALITLAGLAVVAATAWSAAAVLRRLPAAQPSWLRPVALVTVSAGMAVTTVAAVIWGLQLRSRQPAAFSGDYGLLAGPFVPSWIAVVAALAVATALAALATRRQLAVAHQQ